MARKEVISSSFRDPSGFIFYEDGILYRQINIIYKENYDHLINSNLYKILVERELLISHEEINFKNSEPDTVYKIIKPDYIPFISYPYEWCFSQLKDAALTTLEIQKEALSAGMSLKDCSVYNIQFCRGKPILIDTLSLEKYHEGRPWVAYRQFCQHFLAPLALMSFKDIRLNQLLRIYIDGIPLDLASSLLPISSLFSFSILSNIHLHARSQKHYANKTINISSHRMSRFSLLSLIENLESTIKGLRWKAQGTEWADYYDNMNYSDDGFNYKKQIVDELLGRVKPTVVWDLGANVGKFSRIASEKGIPVISFDIDYAAVEKNYLECVSKKETKILPLLLDITNPSPGIGWDNQERMSWIERGPSDSVLALALIHHLAISNNLPLDNIACFFNKICSGSLIIEFVSKSDSQVQRLLSTREDIFPNYTKQIFEIEFKKYFIIEHSVEIQDSKRTLYLMKRK